MASAGRQHDDISRPNFYLLASTDILASAPNQDDRLALKHSWEASQSYRKFSIGTVGASTVTLMRVGMEMARAYVTPGPLLDPRVSLQKSRRGGLGEGQG